jgi:hypothetical protein
VRYPDNRLIHTGEVVSLTARPRSTPQKSFGADSTGVLYIYFRGS